MFSFAIVRFSIEPRVFPVLSTLARVSIHVDLLFFTQHNHQLLKLVHNFV
jgi:hypothetical protein